MAAQHAAIENTLSRFSLAKKKNLEEKQLTKQLFYYPRPKL